MLLAQSEEQTKDTRLSTESQKDEKEPERSEIEKPQGKHRFCPEKQLTRLLLQVVMR
jgi:hypothetical protein